MAARRKLGVVSLGFLRQPWLRHALWSAGWEVVPGWSSCDAIGVWGRRPVSARGRALAARRGLPVVTVEDAFLRSLRPGDGPPLGLLIDEAGVHYDPDGPSDVVAEISSAPVLSNRGAEALELLRHHRLSKYMGRAEPPADLPRRYVLVVDQTEGDASLMGADRAAFARMMREAAAAHPDLPLLLVPHPEVAAGRKRGMLNAEVVGGARWLSAGHSPAALIERAEAVHVMSSQFGLDAVLHGHRPHVHGHPVYAGWGLTEDACAAPRGSATVESLFAALFERAPLWIDPATGARRDLLETVTYLASITGAARRTGRPMLARGVSRWKRRRVRALLSTGGAPVRFGEGAPRPGETAVAWASRADGDLRIEDGFLRSRGLGAALVPPLSLAFDDLGIHYDPARPSRLEALIAASSDLPDAAKMRAARLRARIVAAGASKYNLGGALPDLPPGPKVLVTGQVADDASVQCGAGGRTDRDLLAAARAAHPEACLIWKPHPDVVAGLRAGVIDAPEADVTVAQGDIAELIPKVDRLWTLTSLAGFEALLRGVPVTCLGWPFYAGWGLTEDLGESRPERRRARPDLDGLVHAALIDYPLYLDPRTGRACGPEDLLAWLESGGVERSRLGWAQMLRHAVRPPRTLAG
ncbi:capsular polysaccharide biosynthesis protein [Pontivivens ytuae]|uniref:Capsular polysaccharide biosynthesis protein n=1 Tax=Pontivivens ytuae TaxID=2789856 RepID=A0A7S9QDD6_9RHOB|nr:capsular polysaccharide biosynthesis protein [Pontivivens ytuae]QPH54277.1 capsular polysaccharide biosynthesis protein [Pontivivens ytuae]